jgi:hypothetical protein
VTAGERDGLKGTRCQANCGANKTRVEVSLPIDASALEPANRDQIVRSEVVAASAVRIVGHPDRFCSPSQASRHGPRGNPPTGSAKPDDRLSPPGSSGILAASETRQLLQDAAPFLGRLPLADRREVLVFHAFVDAVRRRLTSDASDLHDGGRQRRAFSEHDVAVRAPDVDISLVEIKPPPKERHVRVTAAGAWEPRQVRGRAMNAMTVRRWPDEEMARAWTAMGATTATPPHHSPAATMLADLSHPTGRQSTTPGR